MLYCILKKFANLIIVDKRRKPTCYRRKPTHCSLKPVRTNNLKEVFWLTVCNKMVAFHTMREMATDFVKLERFDGGNFILWQRRIHFLLVFSQVIYVWTLQTWEKGEWNHCWTEAEIQTWWWNLQREHVECNARSIVWLLSNVHIARELWQALIIILQQVRNSLFHVLILLKWLIIGLLWKWNNYTKLKHGERKTIFQVCKYKRAYHGSGARQKGKKSKKEETWFFCGLPDHFKKDCCFWKKKKEETTTNA